MQTQQCKVAGCSNPHRARGYCSSHYSKLRRSGKLKPKQPEACSVQGCENTASARSWCEAHYKRWRTKGDVESHKPIRRSHDSPEESFLNNVREDSECLVWTGSKNSNGYGLIWLGDRSQTVHRYAWEQKHGPVPDSLELNHKCWNRACVNVLHLQLATRNQNAAYRSGARSDSATGIRNVSYRNGSYVVTVKKDGQLRYAKTFETLHEADIAAGKARADIFGIFAGRG